MSVDFKTVRDSYALSLFFEGDMGAKGKVVSGRTRYSACPNCGPSSDMSVKVSVSNGKWHCFACEDRGDVIDAASKFYGVSPAKAAMQLANAPEPEKRTRVVVPQERPVVRDQVAITQVIELLLKAQKAPDGSCLEYLAKRGINKDVALAAVMKKMMITLPGDPNVALRYLLDVVGRELLEKSGIWKEGSKAPAIVYRPLAFVSNDKQGIEFRLIKESSVAMAKAIRYGQPSHRCWAGNDKVRIVEGFIDLLSARVMGTGRTIIGLPGAKNWDESDEWLQALKGKQDLLIALDSDMSGDRGAEDLATVLNAMGVTTRRHKHPDGCKDLNDQLKRQLGIA